MTNWMISTYSSQSVFLPDGRVLENLRGAFIFETFNRGNMPARG
jgi:hypothetical protein